MQNNSYIEVYSVNPKDFYVNKITELTKKVKVEQIAQANNREMAVRFARDLCKKSKLPLELRINF